MLELDAFEAPEQDAPAGPQAHVAALPVPAFASCGSERGICDLVTSLILFGFCRKFSPGRHFVEVIMFDAEAFLRTMKSIEACGLHGIPR